jgi:hypothetical protein
MQSHDVDVRKWISQQNRGSALLREATRIASDEFGPLETTGCFKRSGGLGWWWARRPRPPTAGCVPAAGATGAAPRHGPPAGSCCWGPLLLEGPAPGGGGGCCSCCGGCGCSPSSVAQVSTASRNFGTATAGITMVDLGWGWKVGAEG